MPDPAHNASLGDVATRAGVSKATASRAIRGLPGVAPDKAAAVARAMHELGYRPDPMLAAFSRYRWPEHARGRQAGVAHLVDRWTVQHREVHRAIDERCAVLGYRCERHEVAIGEGAGLAERVARTGPLGLLVDLHDDQARLALPWQDYCGIILGESMPGLELPRVGTDWHRHAADAAARLRALGHQRIGFVIRRFAGSDLTIAFVDAALAARHATRGSEGIPLLVTHGVPRTALPEVAAWWRKHRPSAVIAETPDIAGGLVAAGADIPAICSFITLAFGGADAAGLPASGYAQELPTRARIAMDLLHARILHRERGLSAMPPRLLVPGRWVEGRTVLKRVAGRHGRMEFAPR